MNGSVPEALVPLLWICGAIAALGLVLVRMRRARQRRPASALPAFLRHFEAKGVPVEVAATVFRQLQRWMQAQDRHFPVRHDQSLRGVYGLVPEELDAALQRLAPECGRRFDPSLPHPPIETVSDLVKVLASCPEQETPEAQPRSEG